MLNIIQMAKKVMLYYKYCTMLESYFGILEVVKLIHVKTMYPWVCDLALMALLAHVCFLAAILEGRCLCNISP